MENHVNLKEFVERIFDERQRLVDVRFQSIDIKLEHLNHLRDEMATDRARYVSQDKFDLVVSAQNEKIADISAVKNKLIGIGLVLGAIAGAVGGIIGHLIK